jgi:hypothetical protein
MRDMNMNITERHVFESSPFWKRPAFYATTAMIVLCWVVTLAMASFSLIASHAGGQFRPIASLIFVTSMLFALYLAWFTTTFIWRCASHYAVSAGDGKVTLFVDRPIGRHEQITVSAVNLDYLEHFSATDQQTMVCHLKDGRIVEIPLWAFPESASEITRILKSGDVQTLTV